MEEGTRTLHDYLDILKRRKKSLILPPLIFLFIAIIVAIFYPPVYRSIATILIEEQEIPRDYVQTTITGFAEQRLQTLNQRIMSTSKLLEIINRFSLYPDFKKNRTVEEITDIMRRDIQLTTISPEITNPQRGGAPTPVTIAFTISYDGRDPPTVQQVTSVLSSLFLEENLKVREERALGASKFLSVETVTVQKQLAEVDARIARYKEKHFLELPELHQMNVSSIDRVENEIDRLRQQLTSLREKESYLLSQLSTVPRDDATLLRELRAKLTQLKSKYSEKHPDVIKTNKQLAELKNRNGASRSAGASDVRDQPDNPAYVNLASQLAGVKAEMNMVKRQNGELNLRRDEYYRRMEAAPKVEQSYKALLAERNSIQLKVDDLMKKSLEAKTAQGLERERMGERFTIIDPARLPEKPIKPNIPAILFIGLFLGIVAAVGTASLQEFNDRSVRDPKTLSALTHVPVLAAIPYIITEKEIKGQIEARKRFLTAGLFRISRRT